MNKLIQVAPDEWHWGKYVIRYTDDEITYLPEGFNSDALIHYHGCHYEVQYKDHGFQGAYLSVEDAVKELQRQHWSYGSGPGTLAGDDDL